MPELPRPLIRTLLFEVTGVCNLRCRYCYNIWHAPAFSRPAPRGSYQAARRTLAHLLRQADVEQVVLTGGEPLLAERVLELALFLRLRGKAVSIITNGNGGDRAAYRALVDLGVTLFELPLHSPEPETHDALTGVRGSWMRVTRSLDELRDLGIAPVGVIVITRLNAHLVGDTIRALQERGVSRVMLARFNVGGRGIREREALEPTLAQLRGAFGAAQNAARSIPVQLSSNVCTPLCALSPAEFPNIAWSNCSADLSRRPLTLDVEGNLRFCNHSPIVAGSLFAERLADILVSPYLKSWASSCPQMCSTCSQWQRCQGGCRAAAEQLGVGLTAGDPLVVDAHGRPRAGVVVPAV